MRPSLKTTRVTGHEKGFTLIEIMVALVMTGVIMAGVFSVYTAQQKAYLGQEQIVDMQQNLRAAMAIMAKEIRMAGYDPHLVYNPGITAAGTGANGAPLVFTLVADEDTIDNDGDGTVDEKGELKTITYQLFDANGNGNVDIGRNDGVTGLIPIAENIGNLLFTYMDKDGVVTAVIDDISTIMITVTAIPEPGRIDHANATRTLISRIKCRNLGF